MRQNKRKALLSVICLVSTVFACASCLHDSAAPAATVSAPYASVDTAPETVRTGYEPFNDAVFIGDCISVRLKNYVTEKRQSAEGFMGTAQFLTAAGLGSANALEKPGSDSKHPTYKGEKMSIEDGVLRSGAKKAYIMLGMSDLNTYGVKEAAQYFETLVGRIEAKVPGITVCIQSVAPVTKDGETEMLNNETIGAYNDRLRALCEKKGYDFIDVASVLRDREGNLPEKYANDDESRPNEAFCSVWIEYLLEHAV